MRKNRAQVGVLVSTGLRINSQLSISTVPTALFVSTPMAVYTWFARGFSGVFSTASRVNVSSVVWPISTLPTSGITTTTFYKNRIVI